MGSTRQSPLLAQGCLTGNLSSSPASVMPPPFKAASTTLTVATPAKAQQVALFPPNFSDIGARRCDLPLWLEKAPQLADLIAADGGLGDAEPTFRLRQRWRIQWRRWRRWWRWRLEPDHLDSHRDRYIRPADTNHHVFTHGELGSASYMRSDSCPAPRGSYDIVCRSKAISPYGCTG